MPILHRIRYPWLRKRRWAHWPRGPEGNELLRKLNNTARALQLRIVVTSGRRTPYEQWLAYMDHLRGGTLAAPCCQIRQLHSWADCQRQCMSNHCANRAADVVVALTPDGPFLNIGEHAQARVEMRRHGLCLPVGQGETWHVEIGDVWRS